MKELKIELDKINNHINELKKRKSEIEKQMMDSETNFMKKFKIWYESDDECHHDWIINSPILRKLLDRRDLDRHRTYTLEDIIGEDEFTILVYPEDCKDWYDSEAEFKLEYGRCLVKYKAALEEAMNTDMKSFTCDW